MPADPNPPVVPVDTSAVSGNTGPAPSGSASAVAKPDTTITGGGPGTTTTPAVSQPDTALAGGPALANPASTAISGTIPSTGMDFPGGITPANPAYVAPNPKGAPAVNVDTTRTDQASVAGVPAPTTQDYAGTLETNNIGKAPTGASGVGVPVAPTSPTVAARDGAVLVGWTASADPSNAPVRGYYVVSSKGDTFTAPRGTSLLVDVEPNVAMTFRVAAFNANGQSALTAASASVTAYNAEENDAAEPGGLRSENVAAGIYKPDGTLKAGTGLPGVPLTVTGVSGAGAAGTAVISWLAPTGDRAPTSYIVTPYLLGVKGADQASAGTGLTKTVTGLTPNTAYTFTVTAVNAVGNSRESVRSGNVTTRP